MNWSLLHHHNVHETDTTLGRIKYTQGCTEVPRGKHSHYNNIFEEIRKFVPFPSSLYTP